MTNLSPSGMRPLIAVMNARKMSAVYAGLKLVPIDTVWMTGYWEIELNRVMSEVVERAEREEYTHLALLSDDIVVSLDSVQQVIELAKDARYPAVTAYCDMFRDSPDVNITKQPFTDTVNPMARYYLYTRQEVDEYPDEVIPTWFMGWSFSMMPIALWKEVPFLAIAGSQHDKGWASDWHSSVRLYKKGIQMVAPRGAFVRHLKGSPGAPLTMKRPTRYDIAMWKRNHPPLPESELLIGQIPKQVTWEYKS